MRILSIANCMADESLGSGYVIANFIRGMRARGHEVDFFGPDDFNFLGFVRKARSHRQSVGMLLCALRQLRTKAYDVVELWGGEAWLVTPLLSLKPRRRFLLAAHSNGLECHSDEVKLRNLGAWTLDGSKPGLLRRVLRPQWRLAFSAADGIVTVSDYDRRYAVEKKLQPPERVLAIENPLPQSFLGQRVDFSREQVIGYCGSWMPQKGSAAMRSDLPRLLAEFPQCRVRFIGVGNDFKPDAFFPNEILPRVEVIPFVSDRERLREMYRTLSILVMPSVYESFGLVAAESMACGCALAAPRTGFAADLRDREEFVAMHDPHSPSLYEAVRELLASESFRRVQSLKWEPAIEAVERAYVSWLRGLRSAK
jgi:glycosyltransferase involved in cell wall biosynthesis